MRSTFLAEDASIAGHAMNGAPCRAGSTSRRPSITSTTSRTSGAPTRPSRRTSSLATTRLRGAETWFLTGTDEHGLKIQRVAAERGITPQALADEISAKFREAWPLLGLRAGRLHPHHRAAPQDRRAGALAARSATTGDIYLGHYEGLYCVGCEAYYTEKELKQPGNLCPIHGTPAESMKEESYFFRLSRYAERLLELYTREPDVRAAAEPIERGEELRHARGSRICRSRARPSRGGSRSRTIRATSCSSGSTRSSNYLTAAAIARGDQALLAARTCTSSARTSFASTRCTGRRC